MPIHAARDLQLSSDSVAARFYQERLYSSGPAGAIMREIWLLVAQMPAEFGWSPRISRTPPGFELSAPFAFSDTTGSAHACPAGRHIGALGPVANTDTKLLIYGACAVYCW